MMKMQIRKLRKLMDRDGVTDEEIRSIVSARRYYPIETPIYDYDPIFVSSLLVGAWGLVYAAIKKELRG